jgi:hypothetical protein
VVNLKRRKWAVNGDMQMAEGRFPKAYVNQVRQDDSLMQYVTFPTMDIGARKSGMPKSAKPEKMGLDHVGGTATGSK